MQFLICLSDLLRNPLNGHWVTVYLISANFYRCKLFAVILGYCTAPKSVFVELQDGILLQRPFNLWIKQIGTMKSAL